MKELTELTSEIFLDILKGAYDNLDSEYSKYYIENQGIKIEKVKVTGKLEVKEPFTVECRVEINESIFVDNFILENITFENDFKLKSNTFNESVAFDIIARNGFNIITSKFEDSIVFKGGEYHEPVGIINSTSERLSVHSGDYKSEFSIYKGKINEVDIKKTNDCVLFIINKLIIYVKNKNISLNNLKINQLFLEGEYDSNNIIEIDNIELHGITINSLKNKGLISFSNIKVNNKPLEASEMTISDFYKKNNISEEKKEKIQKNKTKIDESKPLTELCLSESNEYFSEREKSMYKPKEDSSKSIFKIEKSQLGQMEFKNFPLKNFNELEIIDTELATIKTFNTLFPTNKIKGNYRSLYEIFNDLYTVASNKNNKFEEIEYYKASQNLLLKSLDESYWEHIPSIFSLCISKGYSNFGTRWAQSFFITTPLIALIFFSCMLLVSNFDVDSSSEGINALKENIKYYFGYFIQFMNPLHKITFMDNTITNYKYSLDGCFVLLDFLGRIFVSTGIFETIKSFRKYVRR